MYVCTDILFEAARNMCHKDKRIGKKQNRDYPNARRWNS